MDDVSGKPHTPKTPLWKRNLIILWFGTFMASVGFSEVMPFLSLYVATLGHFSRGELSIYSGVTFAATYLVAGIVSPMWGSLADRLGRKPMLLRASLGMALVMGCMGLVSNVWELIVLRLIQGIFSGYIGNANTLIATQAPKENSGRALGTLATGSVSGSLLGPLLGGVLAQFFGYRPTFFITGVLLLSAFVLTLIFVKEDFEPVTKEETNSPKEVVASLKHPRLVFALFFTTLIIQASNTSISPIISLYVKQIMHGSNAVSLFAGIVSSVPGIATILAAPRLGELGDRVGTELVLTFGFVFAILIYIPMAFVTNVWQLIGLRFLIGVSNASMLPSVQTLLSKNSPTEVTGRVFSWNQSFQYLGMVVGPVIGSLVSGAFNYQMVFISTSVLVAINFLWVWNNTRSLRKKHLDQLHR
nr:multidrug efflux MFS transporter [Levilactobacillus bambusae]